MMRIWYCLFGLFSLLAWQIAYTDTPFQGRWYQIELVVYSHLNVAGLNSEQWPIIHPDASTWKNAVQLITTNGANLNSTNTALMNYQLLPKKDFLLKKDAQKINQQANYHVILHLSWRQQVFSSKQAKPIHIYGGNLYSPSGQIMSFDEFGQTAYQANQHWQLNGTLTINVKRYFNVHFNLFFAAPMTNLAEFSHDQYFNQFNSGLAYFHLIQTRRMRSDELNLIGYPIYGVLIKIIPVKNGFT